MRKLVLGTVIALVGFTLPLGLIGAQVARADTNAVDFESPYTTGSPNGQDGWVFTGPYDAAIDSSFGTPGFGAQSLRMSNATTSGSFGDWVFSKPLADEAGESTAANGGLSGGTRQNHFEAQFDIASKTGATQPGLQISVSPDRGDGARMSFLRFKDNGSGGTDVLFDDYQDLAPFGSVGTPTDGCSGSDDFVETNVATISDSAPHTIKLVMDFPEGQGNDVVKVFVDGSLVHTGTSWEDYYRYCEATLDSRTVDSLILQARAGGGTAPATFGNGFLIDNMNLTSSTTPQTYVVDDDGMAAVGDCDATSAAYSTVSDAVAAASAGDTIDVCPGSYPELVTIPPSKPGLTLNGAQSGVDARTRATSPADESVMKGPGGSFYVRASDTTVDGFTVQDTTTGSPLGVGLFSENTTSGTQILNNIFKDNIMGAYPSSDGTDPSLIEHNLFKDNNEPGAASGNGIYSDQGMQNTTINENKFVNNTNDAVVVDQFTGTNDGITISGNEADSGFAVFFTKNLEISGNTVLSNTTGGSTVVTGDDSHNVSIHDNVLLDGVRGVKVDDFGRGPSTNVTVNNNCIVGNTDGLILGAGADSDAALDAESNWWGDPSGPSGTGPGTGDSVVDPDGKVDFTPFLVAPPGGGCPPEPSISIGDASVTEGNSGTTNAMVPVTLSGPTSEPVDVNWTTGAGGDTATAGTDYVTSSGTVHWDPNDATPKTILVPVKGDKLDEPDETFTVTLDTPSHATITPPGKSTVTINDDDNAPKVSIFGVSQLEGDGPGTTIMKFKVAIPKKSGKDITVHYQTSKGSARPGIDYYQRHGEVTIPAGKNHVFVKVRIIGDTELEVNDNFSVGISAPVNTTIADGSATGVILNDD